MEEIEWGIGSNKYENSWAGRSRYSYVAMLPHQSAQFGSSHGDGSPQGDGSSHGDVCCAAYVSASKNVMVIASLSIQLSCSTTRSAPFSSSFFFCCSRSHCAQRGSVPHPTPCDHATYATTVTNTVAKHAKMTRFFVAAGISLSCGFRVAPPSTVGGGGGAGVGAAEKTRPLMAVVKSKERGVLPPEVAGSVTLGAPRLRLCATIAAVASEIAASRKTVAMMEPLESVTSVTSPEVIVPEEAATTLLVTAAPKSAVSEGESPAISPAYETRRSDGEGDGDVAGVVWACTDCAEIHSAPSAIAALLRRRTIGGGRGVLEPIVCGRKNEEVSGLSKIGFWVVRG